jgi:hypothetical protein
MELIRTRIYWWNLIQDGKIIGSAVRGSKSFYYLVEPETSKVIADGFKNLQVALDAFMKIDNSKDI